MNSDIITEQSLLDSSGQPITIARYVIKSVLGRSSTGIAYLAFDPQSRNDVVLRLNRVSIKVLDYWNLISRGILEISSLIAHESTPKLLDLGVFENSTYLVHEFIAGETIDQLLISGAVLDTQKLIAEFMRVAEALDRAHSFGLIHSDLKPANFVLNSQNHLFVLDLSMSVFRHCCSKYSDITEESSIIGTPAYLSPEQIKDRHSDARSDLFSFAAVVFKTLTNQQAFDGHSYAEITHAILNQNEKSAYSCNPQLGKGIDQIFKKALSKDSNQRYVSAVEFILALQKSISFENKSLRSVAATLINPTASFSKLESEDTNKNQYQINTQQLNQNNFLEKHKETGPGKNFKTDLKSNPAKISRAALILPSVSTKALLWVAFVIVVLFIILIFLALYPRSTTLVLQNDPLISNIHSNDLTEDSGSAKNQTNTREQNILIEELAFKRAETKAIIDSIIEAKPQDVILPELLQKFQLNQNIYQDPNFQKLFKHESYLVKVSVIKKVIEAKVVDYLPQIRLSLSDADPLVRGFAVKAIGILGTESDRELLSKVMATEKQSEVKQAMSNALKRLESSAMQ